MAKKKRMTRKQLLKEPDEFLTFSRRQFRFVMEHTREASIVLGVFFAIIIVISGIRYFSDKAEDKASALLGKSMIKYETAMKDSSSEKAYAEVEPDFHKILKEYSGKDAAKMARIVYAGICYDADDPDKAIELYSEATEDFGDNPSFRNIILSGLGYAYEKKKDYKTAVTYFEKISKGSDLLLKDEAFFNLGRLYAELGDTEKSADAFRKIVSDYSDSMYVELAKEKIAG